MSRVAIITDSLACVPREIADELGIFIVPSIVTIADKVYRDGVDITPSEVYELQRRSRMLPTTSAASPGEFFQTYLEAARSADAILHVCITPSLTMTYEAAMRGREMVHESNPSIEVEILDTGTAAGAQGFLAMAAARKANAGADLAETVKTVKELIPRMQLYVTVDTLHYLAKGGRVPKVAAWASSLLSIKPILQISGGLATPVERVRTKPRAVSRLLEIMQEKAGSGSLHVNIMHAGVPQEAQELRLRIANKFAISELYISEFSPVMGAHTGPGLIGIAFYGDI